MSRSNQLSLSIVLALALPLGCAQQQGEGTARDGHPRGELVVFAAASLTDAFTTLGDDFKKANPDIDLKFSFAGSQSLRTQIENGAQPQVFASANAKHIELLRESNLVNEPELFTRNEMVIVVPRSNPARIESLADLARTKKLVLAEHAVPAGGYSLKVLSNARSEYGANFAADVQSRVVSRELHVRQTLQKVVIGEADAALVYATDAASVGDRVKTIAIPPQHNAIAEYPIAQVSGSHRQRLGRRFVDFVLSQEGQKHLVAHGFRSLDSTNNAGP